MHIHMNKEISFAIIIYAPIVVNICTPFNLNGSYLLFIHSSK